MAIMTILAAALAVVLPKLRTRAMSSRAKADIEALSNALTQYYDDIGYYPVAPFVNTTSGPFADDVLYNALTNRHAGGYNRGWAAANTEWPFIHEGNVVTYKTTRKQVQDPWGVPYYYVAHPDYLHAVCIYDPADDAFKQDKPNYYGTTPVPDDFRTNPAVDHYEPHQDYYGPPPRMDAFYNATTFQIHSKGPDQLTDVADAEPEVIDATDRGTDTDDENNF
jgi:type II secretory pathway pseudopilin PulG